MLRCSRAATTRASLSKRSANRTSCRNSGGSTFNTAPHVQHDAVTPRNRSARRFPSEVKADFSRHRPPDDIAEDVLLHGCVQEILTANRDGHLAVHRVHAESAVDKRVRAGGSLKSGKDILPERAVHVAPQAIA